MVATITRSHAQRGSLQEARDVQGSTNVGSSRHPASRDTGASLHGEGGRMPGATNRYGLPRVGASQVGPNSFGQRENKFAPTAFRQPLAANRGMDIEARAESPATDWSAGLAPMRFPDCQANHRLWDDEHAVRIAFDAIVPALKEIAALQHEHNFVPRAQQIAQQQMGFPLPEALLQNAWVETLDMRDLYAYAVCQTYQRLREREAHEVENVEDAQRFFLECGFHSVDVSPCADGRLKGLVKYILRLPARAVHREAYAGALFDIEESVRRWADIELRRHREGVPSLPDAPTQYLKIAVYHWSGSDSQQGCAAHGSDARAAAQGALDRLNEFRQAIENSYCCGASVTTLLIGVDTDNDAIKIHVPDGKDEISVYRYVDSQTVYQQVMQGTTPRAAVIAAVEQALAVQGWGKAEGRAADGMLRFIASLLENNLKQQDYVDKYYQGRYPDIGHQERFISVGNGNEDVQLRNLAYYAHMDTLEEGAADLDVGVKIFKKLNAAHGLPTPIILQISYNRAVPNARARARCRALRLGDAIRQRYGDLAQARLLSVFTSLQDKDTGAIEFVAAHEELVMRNKA
ncbi:MAG: carboxysome shell carbonic anhydrase [Gammaproteobacteria bacterium]